LRNGTPAAGPRDTQGTPITAWLRLDTQGTVTFMMSQSEMGQGVHTGLAMIVAEELDADYDKVGFEQAPVTEPFFNPRYIGANGGQGTGGSSSISQLAPVLRHACAAVRDVLLRAGAQTLQVAAAECQTDAGFVIHAPSGRRVDYGALAEAAAALPLPEQPRLKEPKEFKLLGTFVPRRDIPAKINGGAVFGLDVKVPGALVALVARCPVFGGTLGRLDADAARQSRGVHSIVEITAGVAVVADSFWHAKKGRDALQITWNANPDPRWDSDQLSGTLEQLATAPGISARNEGDAEHALAQLPTRLDAVYESQYLDPAPMEPMNCTAWVQEDRCEIWAPTQFQSRALSAAQRITGLPADRITINTTYLGGGFGRRFYHDYVDEAVEVSKAVGRPVKVMRTREDDMTHSFYRPASHNRISAGLDADGRIAAWHHRAVSSSILKKLWPERINAATGFDATSGHEAANLLYDIPNYRFEWVPAESPVPVGIWRSVGDSQNTFVTQCFIDELAHAAGRDPYEFRRAHLGSKPGAARLRAVLDMVAEKAGWGTPLPSGRHRGIAAVQCYGAFAAQVAEVSIGADGQIVVHRIVAGLDCGWVTSPDLVRQQAEGGIMFGLSAALGEAITIKGGAVEQSNFHQYPTLRMSQMPVVEFHLMPSEQPPLSVGEPAGTPCVAPAVANAVFAATGVRMRSMPFSRHVLKQT
ncbi:xanthine dehydrogenase family protein molybdopterin-binding subunit, partial [Bordetella petrii]|uniref:xanthine dehydrogenase family protein molybdopterin-binding subunit n=1 Tax=Bordetella petrii TaxID=94624 RepID=UPI001E464197